MKVKIGNKIKALRDSRRITQERLAEHLGMTAQAISRWENETCYPDMEMLPAIADYFGITLDELLCVDRSKNDAKIEGYIKTANDLQCSGKFDEAVDIYRTAVREFPSSFLLLTELACAIGAIDNGQKIAEKSCDEAVSLCTRILDDCLDDNLRLRAKHILCFVYARHLDNAKSAGRIADTMPAMERSLMLAETLKVYPPSEEGVRNVTAGIGVLLILFGNKLGYRVEQHPEESIAALVSELNGFKI